MAKTKLLPAERIFFNHVAEAVFSNPFSAERRAADEAIIGEHDPDPSRTHFARLIEAVSAGMRALESSGRADLRHYGPEEREVLAFAFLFDLYHRRIGAIDAVIQAQEAAGPEPVPVPFADELMDDLRRRGFSGKEARRNLELFFQLRRAFRFIGRALIGESACMQELRQALWNNIFTRDIRRYATYLWDRMEDFSTLLLGETGTGKGSAANAIGRSGFLPFDSKRGRFVESFAEAFVSLNLSQFSETLIESELFGHRKGAFTGAVDEYEGVFATCSPHGAIFLDEIGEIDEALQIKLLRVLQERVFTPVGSRRTKRFRGRVIAATNKDLAVLRGEHGFRDDFYYRLCSDVIVVPPLRQRLEEAPEELEDLVRHTLERLVGIEASGLEDLVCGTIERDLGRAHPWPGNVRELEQCVRRILLTGCCGSVSPSRAQADDPFLEAVARGSLDARGVLSGYCARLYAHSKSYEEVARATRLDRRTVKKHIEEARAGGAPERG